jgi:hypothetical protein
MKTLKQDREKEIDNNAPLTLPVNWDALVKRWLEEPDDFKPAGYCPPPRKAPTQSQYRPMKKKPTRRQSS